MSKSYAVLPCNGLDKCAGCLSREIALNIAENSDSKIICPVLYRVAEARYNKLAEEKPLLVIDGCNTRCASKLAAEKNLKVAQKINVTEEAKSRGIAIGGSLRPNGDELRFARAVMDELLKQEDEMEKDDQKVVFPDRLDYEIYKKDKFIFRLPNGDFYFNENDCWAFVSGKFARIGVTDFVQQSLSDIMFFTPPTVGSEIEQFGELGTVESGKAVFEVVSPVSGKIIAVNDELSSAPELINQNPYEKGWIADIELTDFDSDKELLLDFDGYFKILKRKVDEFHVR
jgi:glycine cleavage system H protein